MSKIVKLVMPMVFALSPVVYAKGPQSLWEGFYMGLDMGGAWSSSQYRTDPGCGPVGVDCVFCNVSPDPSVANGEAVASSGSQKFHFKSANIGFHLGHNWITDTIVFGGELDFSLLNLGQSESATELFPLTFLADRYVLSKAVSTHWLSTIRGRIGKIICPPLFLYGTGGAAFTNLKVSSDYHDNAVDGTFPGGSGDNTTSVFRGGWTLGGGGEWQWTDTLSIKAEYLYVDFSSINLFVPTSNTPAFTQTMRVTADLSENIVRMGINYWF